MPPFPPKGLFLFPVEHADLSESHTLCSTEIFQNPARGLQRQRKTAGGRLSADVLRKTAARRKWRGRKWWGLSPLFGESRSCITYGLVGLFSNADFRGLSRTVPAAYPRIVPTYQNRPHVSREPSPRIEREPSPLTSAILLSAARKQCSGIFQYLCSHVVACDLLDGIQAGFKRFDDILRR